MKCLLCGMELKDGSKGEVCPNCRGSLSQNTLTIFPTEEMIEKDLDVYENAVTRLAKEFPQCSDLSLIHALIHIKKGEYKKAEKILDKLGIQYAQIGIVKARGEPKVTIHRETGIEIIEKPQPERDELATIWEKYARIA